MILTAYLDESGTHGGSPTTVMSGVMAHAKQWARFQVELDKLKRKFGFTVFHAKEFRNTKGEFHGWPPEQYPALLHDMMVASSSLMEATTCTLPNADYEEFYRGGENLRKLRLDSKYGLCFRYCLTHFIMEAVRRLRTHKRFGETKLHAVMESGHKNAGDAERIFYEVKKELQTLGLNILGTIAFADKDECDPLMIADYLAYGGLAMERAGRNEPPAAELPASASRTTGMTNMKFTPEGLATLKAQLIEGLKKGGGWKATFLTPSHSARAAESSS